MNLPFDRLEVGQYIPGCRTHARFARADFSDGLWRVVAGIPTMTESELSQLCGGAVRFAPVAAEGCLFFLLRFGELPWFIAPWEPCAVSDADRMPSSSSTRIPVSRRAGA